METDGNSGKKGEGDPKRDKMRIREYRILMPLTVDEYHIGQLWMTAEFSKQETGGGDGVEVYVDEPFENLPLLDNKNYSGRYTFKKYFMESKVSAFVRKMAPKGSLVFEEFCWNAYPYCRTIIKNDAFMKEDFEVKIETHHIADKGQRENMHKLTGDDYKERKVIFLDISDKSWRQKGDPDLRTFKSKKTKRGPLAEHWQDDKKLPFMCCYKLVRVHFRWFGLQRTIENMILKNQMKLFARFNMLIFANIDNWHGMNLEQVRKFERETAEHLANARQQGEVRGTSMED